MNIIRMNLKNVSKLADMAACIGYFDGMHIGHQKLVEETLKAAHDSHLKSGCITFEPDPWCVIKNIDDPAHITSMPERADLGRQMGLDYWIILSFTQELAAQPTFEFEKLLYDMGIRTLVCGFDFTYGSKGSGTVSTLMKQQMFQVIKVDAITYEHEKVSSTRIEKAIEQGDMHLANRLLGRNYTLRGTVKSGSSIGHTYGYPTANLHPKYNSILPKIGVYIGYAHVKSERYRCMINVGHNPTFNYQTQTSIEAYLVDFKGELYNQEIDLEFVEKIRDEKKFESKEALIHQLDIDVMKAKALE